MLHNKDTKILSEINVFLASQEKAASKLIEVFRSLKLDKLSIVKEEFSQAKFRKSDLLLVLLLFPIYGVKNVHDYIGSKLQEIILASKNTLYRLKNEENINWRRIVSNINKKLFLYTEKQNVKTRSETEKCLIVDDTDFEKTGTKIEGIGKIWSHVKSTGILGFKGLFLGLWDGSSFLALDFSLHREKSKNKKKLYGLTPKQRKEQFFKKREKKSHGFKRKKELNISKIQNMLAMLRRAFKRKIQVDYVLVDSWFACYELIKFIKNKPAELIAMFKMGKAKYDVFDSQLSAKQIVTKLKKAKKVKWNRALKMYCTDIIVSYKGYKLRLYFCKTSKRGRWHLLGSTNTKLSVNQAYKIYSIRWSIEVFFKESKNYFAMGKSQSQDFDGQIADISIAMILYNLFSVLKKFNFYQTLGGIFLAAKQEITELTIWQKIWDLLLDFLKTFVSIVDGNFNEMVYKVLKSDAKDNEFIKLLELKLSRELK